MDTERSATERFVELARQYRDWVLFGTDCGPEAARQALTLVSQLYVAALNLSQLRLEDSPESQPPPLPNWQTIYPKMIARLPFKVYGDVFNPLPVPAEPSIEADLADDLADIFADVVGGLQWFEAGHISEALWEWTHQFVYHWGDHATAAIRALHAWLAEKHPHMLSQPISPGSSSPDTAEETPDP
ncbi:Uncharacterized protein OS=Hahella chejuensis (strain KCTC 2396) GN=HCH_01581 PE=4 SV=1 [Tuwongella immobilis]|uniref:DUF5063 domain-containing protein n=1 Tax=Tuwongella immobilis TaxID=692036 RepID=A0A6C2YVX9_9BACT|nr:Uncharacterized protein OS=Hahella chejuensis (strain KCTC 2396) GN=HCH_01581 PE=4 SV=1 [Tuwongella immobilis]VTS07634.1 Uncharacterized protein OS=Hahella chejuensis (strain KCTC 2396) GN=HCH_01581 PE=4 SV=1 [Tuwongella immobilis]